MNYVSEADWLEACESYMGWCTNCKDFTRDDHTEPDAENYPCPECGKNTCMGAEQALILQEITLDVEGD